MRDMPMKETEQQVYSLISRVYDVQLRKGKWSVAIDSQGSVGVFHGTSADGRLSLWGKAVSSDYLPSPVALLLLDAGFDPR